MASSSISTFSLMRRTTTGPGCIWVSGTDAGPSTLWRRAGDRVAVRAGGRVAEQQDELLLDVGRDGVLPAVGLLVDLLPLEPDDVDEEPLGEAVAPHDRGRHLAALVGEAEAAVVEQLGVAVVDEAVHRLRHRGRREPEPLHQPGPDRDDALLLDLEDGFEVLLGGVVPLGHVLLPLSVRPRYPVVWPVRGADGAPGEAFAALVGAGSRPPAVLHEADEEGRHGNRHVSGARCS